MHSPPATDTSLIFYTYQTPMANEIKELRTSNKLCKREIFSERNIVKTFWMRKRKLSYPSHGLFLVYYFVPRSVNVTKTCDQNRSNRCFRLSSWLGLFGFCLSSPTDLLFFFPKNDMSFSLLPKTSYHTLLFLNYSIHWINMSETDLNTPEQS